MGKYDDIIHLPHHQSAKHPHMSLRDRAAQFAPFAALTGFGAVLTESGRVTQERIQLSEEEKAALDQRLAWLTRAAKGEPEVEITFFQPDETKTGGTYRTVTGTVRQVDEAGRCLVLAAGERIPLDEIYGVDGPPFRPRERYR